MRKTPKKTILVFIKILIFSLVFYSCSDFFSPSKSNSGYIYISLPSSGSASRLITDSFTISDVTSYFLTLSRVTSSGQIVVSTISAAPSDSAQFNEIDAGTYIIEIQALKNSECIAFGNTGQFEVVAGETTYTSAILTYNTVKNIKNVTIAKSTFTVGEEINLENFVTAHFSNGYSRILTSEEYSLYQLNENGTYSGSDIQASATTILISLNESDDSSSEGTSEEITTTEFNFDITVNVDTPEIVSQTRAIDGTNSANVIITLNVTGRGTLTCQWYQSTSADNIISEINKYSPDDSTSTEPTTLTSGVNSIFTTFPLYESTEDGSTTNLTYYYYRAVITNTDTTVNGITTESVETTTFGGKVISISAEYTGESITVNANNVVTSEDGTTSNPLPSLSYFSITKTYSDGTTTPPEEATVSMYTYAFADEKIVGYTVGDLPITISLISDLSISCEVLVTYKYNLEVPVASISETDSTSPNANTLAQYTGSVTLNAAEPVSSTSVPIKYYLYQKGTPTPIENDYTYQWYESSVAISKATENCYTVSNLTSSATYSYSYTVTCTPKIGTEYCLEKSTESTSEPYSISVTPYTVTLENDNATTESYTHSNGSSRTLTTEATYTVTLVNAADSSLATRKITWSAESFTLTNATTYTATLGTPAETVSASLVAKDSTGKQLISITISTTNLLHP